MYKKLSIKLTDSLSRKLCFLQEKKEIYYFGFEVLFSSIVYVLLFITTSIITFSFAESILFLVGFFPIRHICGGFHANTYTKCHLLFLLNHLVFIALIKFLPINNYRNISIPVLVFSVLVIFICAPVDHKNKRFIKTEKKRFRNYSLLYIIVLIALILFVLFHPIGSNRFVFSVCLGSLSASISLIVAKINNLSERRRMQ